jgi:uncharacterized membrane protein YdjX (TVP38/TMEM64 family)
MKRSVYILLSIVSIIVLVCVWYYTFGWRYVHQLHLQHTQTTMRNFVAAHYIRAVFYYMFSYTIMTVLGFPIAIPMTLLGGFLFGFWFGGIFALVSSVLGALIFFLLVRNWFADLIKTYYQQRLQEFNERIGSEGVFGYMVSLHLVAVVPYVIINTLAALANISVRIFLLATVLGATPVIFIYSFAGAQFGMIQGMKDIFSAGMIYALALLLVLSLIPFIIKRIIK